MDENNILCLFRNTLHKCSFQDFFLYFLLSSSCTCLKNKIAFIVVIYLSITVPFLTSPSQPLFFRLSLPYLGFHNNYTTLYRVLCVYIFFIHSIELKVFTGYQE